MSFIDISINFFSKSVYFMISMYLSIGVRFILHCCCNANHLICIVPALPLFRSEVISLIKASFEIRAQMTVSCFSCFTVSFRQPTSLPEATSVPIRPSASQMYLPALTQHTSNNSCIQSAGSDFKSLLNTSSAPYSPGTGLDLQFKSYNQKCRHIRCTE